MKPCYIVLYAFVFVLFGGCEKSADETVPPSALDKFIHIVEVSGGEFNMGSTDGQENEKPVHDVYLDSFCMSAFEITYKQFIQFLNEEGVHEDGSKNQELYINLQDDVCPVKYVEEFCIVSDNKEEIENSPASFVTWYGAKAFCDWMTKKFGRNFRLPTEAQWEYAARGGQSSKGFIYSGSEELDEIAWYWENADMSSHVVGLKKANELGLYDLSGNVYEWCSDVFADDYYNLSPKKNPTGPYVGFHRVIRGGCYGNNPFECRSACRSKETPEKGFGYIGFRVVCDQI